MLAVSLSLLLLVVGSYGRLRPFLDPIVAASGGDHASIESPPDYRLISYQYSKMPISHFDDSDNRTFSLRYLLHVEYYKPGGPIFFYTGNEGPIDIIAKNTGFMFDLGRHLSASIVFAEHRFYGESQPEISGNGTFAKLDNLKYLRSEQVLADYAHLIRYLKKGVGDGTIPSAVNAPVIAFGGSYGGMLAAWLRLKYPHVVVGALSSSAPVLQFEGTGVGEGVFESIVKETYQNSGCDTENFPNAWMAIKNFSKSDGGRVFLNEQFHLAPESQITNETDADGLIAFIRDAIEYMAMVNYPYPSNTIKPLPKDPVKVACKNLNAKLTNSFNLASMMYEVMNLFYNYNGSETTFCVPYINRNCSDAVSSVLASPREWPWQACTEMVMPICAKGPPNDLFWDDCSPSWSEYAAKEECKQVFGDVGYDAAFFRPNSIINNYGGNFAGYSNVIFSNGVLDPWSGGGVKSSSPGIEQAERNGVHVITIEEGGHHVDLRHPNSCDPPSVIEARVKITNIVRCWAYPNDIQCLPATTTSTTTTTTTTPTTTSTTSTTTSLPTSASITPCINPTTVLSTADTNPTTDSTASNVSSTTVSTTTTPTTTSTSTTTTTPSTTTSTTTSTSTSTTTTTSTTTQPNCKYVQNGYPWGQPDSSTTFSNPSATTTTASSSTTSTSPTVFISSPPTNTTTPKTSNGSLVSPLIGLVLSASFVIVIRF